MAETRAILRLQSDQVLEDPEIQGSAVLKDDGASQALILDWDEPAGTDRTVTFRDPTMDDAVVYEGLPQTITDKTLAGATTAITDITMVASEVVGLPPVPSGPTAAASKAYVDSLSGGANWKETLLSVAQLDNTNEAFAQAVAFYLDANPTLADTFTITDGVTTETWTFSGASAAFAPEILGNACATMQELAARINADSTEWSAAFTDNLQSINPVGDVVIVYRTVPTSTVDDRIHGSFATPSDGKFVDFGGAADYEDSTVANIPTADPTVANFGLSRLTADLLENETHSVRDSDDIYSWDGDLNVWTLSSASSQGTPQVPTGLISRPNLVKNDIPAVTPPSSGFISTDIPVEIYSDIATNGRMFSIVVPDDYDSGDIEVLVLYQMSSAAISTIVLETQAKIVKSSGTIDTATFPAATQIFAPPSTVDITRSLIFTLTNPSGSPVFTRGDTIQFYLKRLGADGSDTHPGDWVVISCEHRYTGQIASRLANQNGEIFGPISGEVSPSAGFISTDIPTVDFAGGTDQAAGVYFTVPDHWDGFSDAHLRLQYAMSGASGGVVRWETNGNIADVGTGSAVVIPTQIFDLATTPDADPHQTPIIKSIPAALLSKGSFIQLSLKRDVSVGSNNPDDFQLVNAVLSIGTTPVSGIISQTDQFLASGVFGGASGSVSGSVEYPDFFGDFESYHRMISASAAAELHVAFEGRLVDTQTQIETIQLFLKGVGATPRYNLKVYVEGTVGAVFATGPTLAPLTSTKINISGATLSAQPIANRRYFVVLESLIDAAEEMLVSRPFVRQS